MIEVGKYNKLVVSKERDFGFFLKDERGEEVLLPKSLLDGNTINLEDEVEVFVYLDSSDRRVATMKKPIITVGEVGYLEVVSQSSFGAFCNNGLEKDLFVPIREQRFKLLDGKKYLIHAYIDKTGRIAGTTEVDGYLDVAEEGSFKVDDVVSCITYARSGGETLKVAIDGKYRGIILGNEHDEVIYPGDTVEARVKRIYEDGVIGLSTRKKRLDAREEIKEKILSYLKKNNGFMEFNDKSNPEDIKREFKTSKNYFKMALGGLMKEGRIEQGPEGTKLIK
ncbi:S1 RNA-binding domain-containing protein [Clostridium thermobutyricum]|uniref:CvfB family protein n=1 Tax=Clostridium thermobutyricum TaxID=29372 RepID=UPI0018AB3269|nr:S1-like domain-containing RNA-binding protein [Clostridium thermobutyricum]